MKQYLIIDKNDGAIDLVLKTEASKEEIEKIIAEKDVLKEQEECCYSDWEIVEMLFKKYNIVYECYYTNEFEKIYY